MGIIIPLIDITDEIKKVGSIGNILRVIHSGTLILETGGSEKLRQTLLLQLTKLIQLIESKSFHTTHARMSQYCNEQLEHLRTYLSIIQSPEKLHNEATKNELNYIYDQVYKENQKYLDWLNVELARQQRATMTGSREEIERNAIRDNEIAKRYKKTGTYG